MKWFLKHKVYFAWLISLVGAFTSLYYGEIMDIEPCRLCWYQRIAIFPLALFLGIATYKNDHKLATYCIPLAIFGALFALYQSLIQILPSLKITALCGQNAHCTLAGPLPFFSLAGFLAIILLITENSRKS